MTKYEREGWNIAGTTPETDMNTYRIECNISGRGHFGGTISYQVIRTVKAENAALAVAELEKDPNFNYYLNVWKTTTD